MVRSAQHPLALSRAAGENKEIPGLAGVTGACWALMQQEFRNSARNSVSLQRRDRSIWQLAIALVLVQEKHQIFPTLLKRFLFVG